MKRLALILVILLIPVLAMAADVTLKWDASVGATGYKIHVSNDLGVTWQAPIDAGNVTQKALTGISDTVLVLFRVSAYNAAAETIPYWMGAWYDGRKKPPAVTSGVGLQ